MKTNGTPNEALYRQRIWKEILFLYHFISYLTYVSNGSPKKMTLFFEKNIRKGKYLEKENKISRIYQWKDKKQKNYDIKESDSYLSFGYYRLSGNFWLVSFKISYLCLPLFYETRTTPSCHSFRMCL